MIQKFIDAGLKITDSEGPDGRLSGKIGKYNQFCFMNGVMVLHRAEIGEYDTKELSEYKQKKKKSKIK